jgi:hypothetical protein
MQLLRVMRFVRVVRVWHNIQIMRVAKKQKPVIRVIDWLSRHIILRTMLFGFVAFSLAHWVACMFYLIATVR